MVCMCFCFNQNMVIYEHHKGRVMKLTWGDAWVELNRLFPPHLGRMLLNLYSEAFGFAHLLICLGQMLSLTWFTLWSFCFEWAELFHTVHWCLCVNVLCRVLSYLLDLSLYYVYVCVTLHCTYIITIHTQVSVLMFYMCRYVCVCIVCLCAFLSFFHVIHYHHYSFWAQIPSFGHESPHKLPCS